MPAGFLRIWQEETTYFRIGIYFLEKLNLYYTADFCKIEVQTSKELKLCENLREEDYVRFI